MLSILVTGSAGLLGASLVSALRSEGFYVKCFDVRLDRHNPERFNILNLQAVEDAMEGCVGVIHLAAVSRVVHAQNHPELCWKTNVEGTNNIIRIAMAQRFRPWVLFTSSREAYGQPSSLPVDENFPLKPVNIYGRSKVAAETMVNEAMNAGLRSSIVRLSNVYGSARDYLDRVVPAFAHSAAFGLPMRVDGSSNTFDFVHIDDATDGLLRIVRLLQAGERRMPPVHLVTGRPTTLGYLAQLANSLGGARSTVIEAPPRAYDVSKFFGSPLRAAEMLGWRASVRLEEGVQRLVQKFSACTAPT